MTDPEGRALSRALHDLVEHPVVAPDLADRVVRRYHRRRSLQVAAAAASVAVVIAGVTVGWAALRPSATPTPSLSAEPATARALRAAIYDGRFTKPVTFDGGALTLAAPPSGQPSLSESQAIALFRSTGQPTSYVQNVVVGYATATLRNDLRPASGLGFAARPAWVVVYSWGPHSCPAITLPAPRPTMPEGRHVFLVDAATGSAIDYTERGSFCMQPPSGPKATVAQSIISLPWTEVSRTNGKLTFTVQPGGCEQIDGWGQSTTDRGDEFFVYALRPIRNDLRCPRPAARTIIADLAPSSFPLVHAAAGTVVGLYTRDETGRDGFDYYDGGPATSPTVAPTAIVNVLTAHGIACHPPTPTRPDGYRIDFTLVRCGAWTLAYWDPRGEQDALRQMNGADKVGPASLSGTGWQISGDAKLLGQMQKIIGGVLSMPG